MKWIKKCIPTKESLQDNRMIRWMQPWLKQSPNYWKLNKASVSRGVFIGVFNAFMPMPFQTLIAIFMALPMRANLILSLGLLWISNPITIVPIYLFSYKIGAWMLNEPYHMVHAATNNADWLVHQIGHIWKPFLLGICVCGMFFGLLCYFVVLLFWTRIERRFKLR